ncbi:hypothetical protein [Agrococcus sp. Ld7]|uniref:hypothetical protein n=1 Tax=Agrococcus sp. Ld7 TaxID=649148 RepID=UPI00386959DF
MEGRAAKTLLLIALAGSVGVLTGCSGPSDADRARLADVEITTLSDAVPLVEAGIIETYGAWTGADGSITQEVIEPADPARAEWQVLTVCVIDDAQQYLFVPPEQLDEMVNMSLDGCAP